MSAITRSAVSQRFAGNALRNPVASQTFQHGRTAAYRRIATLRIDSHQQSIILSSSLLQSQLPLARISSSLSPHVIRRSISFRDMKKAHQEEKARPARPGAQKKSEPAAESQKQAAPKSQPKAEAKAEETPKAESTEADEAEAAFQRVWQQAQRDEAKFKKQREQARKKAEESGEPEKEAEAPTHGNKSPWQVFTETLNTEFKASKEWNEGTKQLAGSVQDFNQNPNVQKAKEAYSKATEKAGTVTGSALKTTASAIGKSAAWTWDTSVVRGVRAGAGAIGSGIDTVTKPLRETKAFKDVKNTIDDGSSSRYGGWTEKEERRRRREELEMQDAASGKPRRSEPMVEDPE